MGDFILELREKFAGFSKNEINAIRMIIEMSSYPEILLMKEILILTKLLFANPSNTQLSKFKLPAIVKVL